MRTGTHFSESMMTAEMQPLGLERRQKMAIVFGKIFNTMGQRLTRSKGENPPPSEWKACQKSYPLWRNPAGRSFLRRTRIQSFNRMNESYRHTKTPESIVNDVQVFIVKIFEDCPKWLLKLQWPHFRGNVATFAISTEHISENLSEREDSNSLSSGEFSKFKDKRRFHFCTVPPYGSHVTGQQEFPPKE